MRSLTLGLAAAMAFGMCAPLSRADDAAPTKTKVTGVLIDDHCAAKFTSKDNPEQAAEAHPAACAVKCAKGGADFVLLQGKKEMKLDKHGQELAMDYLSKDEAKTKVTVTGEVNGDEIKVESIDKAETPASTENK